MTPSPTSRKATLTQLAAHFLLDHRGRRFTARELAEALLAAYPEHFRAKKAAYETKNPDRPVSYQIEREIYARRHAIVDADPALEIDASDIWWSLLVILALPMALGLLANHRWPEVTKRLRRPLGRFSLAALFAFIVLGLVRERHLLNVQLLPQLAIVVAHNAFGLACGWVAGGAFRLAERDRRAVVIEGGMQNSGLALGIIALQFNADLGMVIIASLWGIWHIVSGMTLATLWRRKDARSGS